jgi:hypothetical protein
MKARQTANFWGLVRTLAPSMIISAAVLPWSCSEAEGTSAGPQMIASTTGIHRQAVVANIRSILDAKLGSADVSTKVQDKLQTLDDRHLRLLASLAERIAPEGNTPGADIAFLLLTALVVLL